MQYGSTVQIRFRRRPFVSFFDGEARYVELTFECGETGCLALLRRCLRASRATAVGKWPVAQSLPWNQDE